MTYPLRNSLPGEGRILGTDPSPPAAADPVRETAASRCLPPTLWAIEQAARGRMQNILSAMKREIDAWPLQDELTLHIRNWHQVFTRHVNAPVDSQCLYLEMFRSLQHILIDPMRLAPLSEPLLGQDGKTYDRKILQLYLNTLSEAERFQCPFVPVKEHALASYMLQHLQTQGLDRSVPEIDAEYAALIASGNVPEIPTSQALKDHQKKLRLQARIERVRQERLAMGQQGQDEIDQVRLFGQTITERTARIERVVDANLAQIRTVNAAMRREQDALVEQLAREDAIELRSVREALDIYSRRVNDLADECEALSKECQALSANIASLRGQCLQLQRDVAELRLALARRQASWTKDLLGTVASVAVCAAVSYMCPQGVSIAPMQNGFKLQYVAIF